MSFAGSGAVGRSHRSVLAFAQSVSTKTPVLLTVTKWYLLPFFASAAFTYHCWYHRLVDRGYGLFYNALKRHDEFLAAQVLLGVVGVGGIVLFEVFRSRLPTWMRFAYFAVVASMIAFFVVDRIVVLFGPTPYWHHP